MGRRRSTYWSWVFLAGTIGLLAVPAARAQDPFSDEEDPFAADQEAASEEDGSADSGEQSGEALPPPTVPEGYDSQPQQQAPATGTQPAPAAPAPGQPGYGQQQPGYGQQQPGYGYQPQQPPPRLQRIPYHEGMQVPEGGRIIEKRRIGLIIAGAAMFAITYGSSVSLYIDNIGFTSWMLVPGIGPFGEAAQNYSATARLFLVLDGVVQLAGLTLFTLGLASKKKMLEYYGVNEPGWRVTPRMGPGGGGLDLRARF